MLRRGSRQTYPRMLHGCAQRGQNLLLSRACLLQLPVSSLAQAVKLQDASCAAERLRCAVLGLASWWQPSQALSAWARSQQTRLARCKIV